MIDDDYDDGDDDHEDEFCNNSELLMIEKRYSDEDENDDMIWKIDKKISIEIGFGWKKHQTMEKNDFSSENPNIGPNVGALKVLLGILMY